MGGFVSRSGRGTAPGQPDNHGGHTARGGSKGELDKSDKDKAGYRGREKKKGEAGSREPSNESREGHRDHRDDRHAGICPLTCPLPSRTRAEPNRHQCHPSPSSTPGRTARQARLAHGTRGW